MQHAAGIDQQRAGTLREPDRLDRQTGPHHAARHHQQRHPADRAVRIGGRDQGAEALRGIGEHRHRTDDAVGAPQARQRRPARATGSALRAGPDRNSRSPGRSRARMATADSACASAASPSAENRSVRRTGCRAPAPRDGRRPRRQPARPCGLRGQGHGPNRASAARSISTMTTPGPPAVGRGSSGNSRSNARSRSASRALPGDSAHAASSTARRTSPTSPGRSSRRSVATDKGFRRINQICQRISPGGSYSHLWFDRIAIAPSSGLFTPEPRVTRSQTWLVSYGLLGLTQNGLVPVLMPLVAPATGPPA